jgi:hypothetical protein
VLFVVGAVALLVFLAVLAALGLVLLVLVGIVMGAERLFGLIVPAYRRRRRERYLTMPTVLIRTVRFQSQPTQANQVIEVGPYELPPVSSEAPPVPPTNGDPYDSHREVSQEG